MPRWKSSNPRTGSRPNNYGTATRALSTREQDFRPHLFLRFPRPPTCLHARRRARVDSLEETTSKSTKVVNRPPKQLQVKEVVGIPNPLLVSSLKNCSADFAVIKRMATKIRSPGYGLSAYFNDAIVAFPELNLFFANEDCKTSSGRSGEVEYQRTIGMFLFDGPGLHWTTAVGRPASHEHTCTMHLKNAF